MLKPDRIPHFLIEHVWISKFMRCVKLNLRPNKALEQVKRWVIAQVFANVTVPALEEVLRRNPIEIWAISAFSGQKSGTRIISSILQFFYIFLKLKI